MSNQDSRIEQLRLKRARNLESQERRRLRTSYGSKLATIIAEATGKPVVLDDFNDESGEPFPFEWPKDIANAPGLVAAYVAKPVAVQLLACFREKLGYVNGKIGFHEKSYLGLAELTGIDLAVLVQASEAAEDSVLFYVDHPCGVILVDCYPGQAGGSYSVVVQGSSLVQELEPCFSGVRNR